jgi:hypothetical protein
MYLELFRFGSSILDQLERCRQLKRIKNFITYYSFYIIKDGF